MVSELYRQEFSKLVAVLHKKYGFTDFGIAEDLVSDTFLLASSKWQETGEPTNPTAWLYHVAKNKALDYLRRGSMLAGKDSTLIREALHGAEDSTENLSEEYIRDSQLRMLFAVCDERLSEESQICLALRILCGFGISEIANAFLTTTGTINKRLFRARKLLRGYGRELVDTPTELLFNRLSTVLKILYLLFNEGYYASTPSDNSIDKDICLEAMRLTYLLIETPETNTSATNGLLSLMCFQASRFEARHTAEGRFIPFEEQDREKWNEELYIKGKQYLSKSYSDKLPNRYQVEAYIAMRHFEKESQEKWLEILRAYNVLLQMEYSPIAAINRTYSLYRTGDRKKAIQEAEKIKLEDYYLYHALLAELFNEEDAERCQFEIEKAISLAPSKFEKEYLAIKRNKYLGSK